MDNRLAVPYSTWHWLTNGLRYSALTYIVFVSYFLIIRQAVVGDTVKEDQTEQLRLPLTQSTPTAFTQAPETRRPPPPWSYDWNRFPAFWFGMNISGMESHSQAVLDARYSLVIIGAFHNLLNVTTRSRSEELSMADQCSWIKMLNSSVVCLVYRQAWSALSNFDVARAASTDQTTWPWWWVTDNDGHVINKTLSGAVSSVWALKYDWRNASAQRFYLRSVIAELLSEGPAVQGAFFDDFDGEGCLGALNATMPSHYTTPTLVSMYRSRLQLFREVASMMNNAGMLPVFGMSTLFNVTNNGCLLPEQDVLSALDGVGFMREAIFSHAAQRSPKLCAQFILNTLEEAALQIPTLFWAPVEANGSLSQIAIPTFLITRTTYSYFGASSGWTDKDFQWHGEYDQRYGAPMDFAQVLDGGMYFRRQYSHCTVEVDCRNLSGKVNFHCKPDCSRGSDQNRNADEEKAKAEPVGSFAHASERNAFPREQWRNGDRLRKVIRES